jgi:hypothetical protein
MNFNEKPISDLAVFRCLYFQKTAGFASGFLLTSPAKSRFLLFLIRIEVQLASAMETMTANALARRGKKRW